MMLNMGKYSADAPSNKVRLTLRFAFSSPAHIIASFFGAGVLRPASGTWGTLAAWVVYMLLFGIIPKTVWFAVIIVTFFVGAWACEVSGKDIGVHDHSSLVIDEVFAIWLVLIAVPDTIYYQIGAFLAFRFFDIVKIQPARYFDQSPRWQNGFGVMLDDLVAAIYAIVVLQGIRWCVQ